ncbi:MAG TPA: VOC family protein [Rubrobacter sp.]|nr:VOC family protein [Rubrobacter sp.]
MGLGRFKVVAGLAVSDMDRAVEFYEEKLGLTSWTGQENNRAYECGEGTVLHVYLSPDHAGGTTATLASWYVREIESLVDVLTSRGVVFERYDRPPILTDDRGIATFEGGAKVAYFKDPDGNTLSLAQVRDRSPTDEDR